MQADFEIVIHCGHYSRDEKLPAKAGSEFMNSTNQGRTTFGKTLLGRGLRGETQILKKASQNWAFPRYSALVRVPFCGFARHRKAFSEVYSDWL
jgi:hypothetical protein